MSFDSPQVHTEKLATIALGVLIELTGDIRGQLIIQGEKTAFQEIGESMFGMQLDGDMLHSFTGELGNMIAGTLSSSIAQSGIHMDITPPDVINEQEKEFHFLHRLHTPVLLKNQLQMQIIVELEEAS